jgi:hypothetical protein
VGGSNAKAAPHVHAGKLCRYCRSPRAANKTKCQPTAVLQGVCARVTQVASRTCRGLLARPHGATTNVGLEADCRQIRGKSGGSSSWGQTHPMNLRFHSQAGQTGDRVTKKVNHPSNQGTAALSIVHRPIPIDRAVAPQAWCVRGAARWNKFAAHKGLCAHSHINRAAILSPNLSQGYTQIRCSVHMARIYASRANCHSHSNQYHTQGADPLRGSKGVGQIFCHSFPS